MKILCINKKSIRKYQFYVSTDALYYFKIIHISQNYEPNQKTLLFFVT